MTVGPIAPTLESSKRRPVRTTVAAWVRNSVRRSRCPTPRFRTSSSKPHRNHGDDRTRRDAAPRGDVVRTHRRGGVVRDEGKSQKVVNLRRDNRMTVMVEDGLTYDTLRGVALEGTADVVEDPTPSGRWA